MLKKYNYLIYITITIFLLILGIILYLCNVNPINKLDIKQRLSENSMSSDNAQNIEIYSSQYESSFYLSIIITDKLYGINQIHYPNGNIIYCNNKNQVSFDYEIYDLEEEYIFSYINGNNDEISFKKSFYTFFTYTGDYQIFTAPETGNYKIECAGASGYYNSGKGAYTSGILNLQKDEQIYIYVGEGNKLSGITYNGGGSGLYGSGGGSTDIRLQNGLWDDFESLKSRIMVAAGGGGQGGQGYTFKGGDGRYSCW